MAARLCIRNAIPPVCVTQPEPHLAYKNAACAFGHPCPMSFQQLSADALQCARDIQVLLNHLTRADQPSDLIRFKNLIQRRNADRREKTHLACGFQQVKFQNNIRRGTIGWCVLNEGPVEAVCIEEPTEEGEIKCLEIHGQRRYITVGVEEFVFHELLGEEMWKYAQDAQQPVEDHESGFWQILADRNWHTPIAVSTEELGRGWHEQLECWLSQEGVDKHAAKALCAVPEDEGPYRTYGTCAITRPNKNELPLL